MPKPLIIDNSGAGSSLRARPVKAAATRGRISDVWLAVVLLVAGSLACTALDRLGGFHLLTRVRPMTMSEAAADALEGTPQTRAAQDPLSQDDWAAKARRDW